MGDLTAEGIRSWAADWADKYDQDWSDEKLREHVGKQVDAVKPAVDEEEGPKGFRATIAGFSVDTILFSADSETDELESVCRYSFITTEGLQVAILSGMSVTIVEDDADSGAGG